MSPLSEPHYHHRRAHTVPEYNDKMLLHCGSCHMSCNPTALHDDFNKRGCSLQSRVSSSATGWDTRSNSTPCADITRAYFLHHLQQDHTNYSGSNYIHRRHHYLCRYHRLHLYHLHSHFQIVLPYSHFLHLYHHRRIHHY